MKSHFFTLTPIECDKLLRHLQQPQNGDRPPRTYHRNYTMAVIMLDTGCRVGELVKLHQDQLWFLDAPVQALTIEEDQAKNNHERTIPTTIRLRDAIHQMHRQWWLTDHALGERAAFYTSNCQYPITVRQVRRIITSAGKLSLGREIHPHLLRHTFATRLMAKTSMRVVQQLLGHSSITSTQIYTHPNHTDYQKAIDAIEEES